MVIHHCHCEFVSERIAGIFESDTERATHGLLVLVFVVMIVAGCSSFAQDGQRMKQPPGAGIARSPASLPALLHDVRPSLERHLEQREAEARRAVAASAEGPPDFAHPWVRLTLRHPWDGLIAMEEAGLNAASGADQRPIDFGALLRALTGRQRQPLGDEEPQTLPLGATLEEHLDFVERVLLKAEDLKEAALAHLSVSERAALFEQAATLVRTFTPQYSEVSVEQRAQLEANHRFSLAYGERVAHDELLHATEVLLWLSHEPWLHAVTRAASRHPSSPSTIDGVSGEIVAVRDTRAGRIVVGGAGENSYTLTQGVALVLDLGGADVYRGTIAAARSSEEGNRLVIDVGGNDRYEASSLGLGTGRLAVGLLVDASGDDIYHLAEGSGGTGFAGIGILYDKEGDDRYLGAKLTQGAAIAGLGLLLDQAGRDEFMSEGYGIGFGGPLGVGAVVETRGDDRYACGNTHPSAYNATDAPQAGPGDPGYQYEGFCLGVGVGLRVLSKDDALAASQQAGGVGFVIDVQGDDRYHSSNFSQGTGYFWGGGVMLDLAGHDHHMGARYGHGAAAHHGVGLFVDAAGRDVYGSTGPVFNAGTAWDRSIAVFLDAGSDDDVYDFSQSDGLGRAAHTSWSLSVEEGGNDHYAVSRGLGLADDESASGFFDLEGLDRYVVGVTSRGFTPDNRRTIQRTGGVFVDR